MIAPWALLLLFYFLRRLGKQGETIGQIAGVVTAAVAVLRYEDLNDWAVRLLGVGDQPVDRSALGSCRVSASSRCCGRSAIAPQAASPSCTSSSRRAVRTRCLASAPARCWLRACDSVSSFGQYGRAESAGERRCSPSTMLRKAC